MVFSTRQQLIFKCSWNLAYDDDETLNSFNEETFNSLQRLVYIAVPRLWFQNFFFPLMKSETYQIKTDFQRRHQHEVEESSQKTFKSTGKSTSKVRDFRMRKGKKMLFWCFLKTAKLHRFCHELQFSKSAFLVFPNCNLRYVKNYPTMHCSLTKSFSMLVSFLRARD